MLTTTLFSLAVSAASINGAPAIVLAVVARPPAVAKELGHRPILPSLAPVTTATARPAALMPLYGSLIALQGADVYFTAKSVSNGAREVNPIVQPVAGKTAVAAAVKAGTTAV